MLSSLAYCAAAIGILMFCVWLVSLALRDVSIIDLVWGIGFVLVGWTAYWTQADASDSMLVPLLVTLWGVRLSVYLAWRNHGQDEDKRYQSMRRRWGDAFPWISVVTVFGVQAVVMWIVSLPLQTLYNGADDNLVWLSVVGTLVFAAGLFFESMGDFQQARFKAELANLG